MNHAILSPSGASRWLVCNPSARMEEKFPSTTSIAAEEGTLAHRLAETMLNHMCNSISESEYEQAMYEIHTDPLFSAEMETYISDYVEHVYTLFCAAKCKYGGAILKIETKLDLSDYIPESFGTCDAMVISDGVLDIIDLKYGAGVYVASIRNKQIYIYALGALKAIENTHLIHRVRMTIFQPRMDNISSHEISVETLNQWAELELKPKAEKAFKGIGELVTGEHCRFCRAKAICRAKAKDSIEMAKLEFKEPNELTDDEITEMLSKADEVKSWLTSIQEYALCKSLDEDKNWDGFELQDGKSRRVYSDPESIIQTLLDNGYNENDICSKELKGIIALEKQLGKPVFELLLGNYVTHQGGKKVLRKINEK